MANELLLVSSFVRDGQQNENKKCYTRKYDIVCVCEYPHQ